MRKTFRKVALMGAIVAVAALSACNKTDDVNVVSTTPVAFTVTESAGGQQKVSEGATVSVAGGASGTTDAQGRVVLNVSGTTFTATYSKAGYASSISNNASATLYKEGAKLNGIATYTDAATNSTKTVPSGTALTLTLGNSFVNRVFTATVDGDGKYEFTNLPENSNGSIVSEFTASSKTYKCSGSTSWQTSSQSNLTYNEDVATVELAPFAVIDFPGKVAGTATSLAIKFNRAAASVNGNVNTMNNFYSFNVSTSSPTYTAGGTFTVTLSTDGKTLTVALADPLTFSMAGSSLYISGNAISKEADGVEDAVSAYINKNIIIE
jgi:hypothetical protein